MEIVYKGPGPDVVIKDNGQTVKRGEPTDVPDDIANALLRQTRRWAKAPAKPKAQPPRGDAPED